MAENDELDLRSLDDDELVKQMHDDLYDGLREEIVEGVNILLERGWQPYDVLTDALVAGMTIVGIDFRDDPVRARGAARRQRDEGRHGDPAAAARRDRAPPVGKMVIGTVKGDIHDIGKNLVSMMMEAPASRSSTSASTARSRSIWTRSSSTSPTSSACRRC